MTEETEYCLLISPSDVRKLDLSRLGELPTVVIDDSGSLPKGTMWIVKKS